MDGVREPRCQPGFRLSPVAGREFDRLNPRASDGLESRNAGFPKAFAGDDGRGRSPNEGKADGQNREPQPPFQPRPKPVARQHLR